MTQPIPPAAPAGSQTLSRGIRALEILGDASDPLTIAELAARLDVHRSIAYRIVRTLEDHGLVLRDDTGRLSLGPRMAALARGVSRDLQSAALPELTAVASEYAMTAFITVLDHGEVVTLVSVEPRHAVATVVQRPGTRHSLSHGAPGRAIQASLSPAEWEALGSEFAADHDIELVRAQGYATSHDEVIAGLSSVSVDLRIPGHAPAAVAVVYVSSRHPEADIARRLRQAAATISADLG